MFKCCRNGLGRTGVIKAVFLPLAHLCTSQSYDARYWLETNQETLKLYYNKYVRSFPSVLMDSDGDRHQEMMEQRSLAFSTIMKKLSKCERIVTSEEHKTAAERERPMLCSVFTSVKYNQFRHPCREVSSKNGKAKPSLNLVIQQCFGKRGPERGDKLAKSQGKPSQGIQNIQESTISKLPIKTCVDNTNKTIESNVKCGTLESSLDSRENSWKEQDSGYIHLQPEDVFLSDKSSVDDNGLGGHSCERSGSCMGNRSEAVSDEEVKSTMHYLQDIFNRILKNYLSAWKGSYEEVYTKFDGDPEDLTRLMIVLPALDRYNINKLLQKWNEFCHTIYKDARRSHVVYGEMVSEIQLFLLEFENRTTFGLNSKSSGNSKNVLVKQNSSADESNILFDLSSLQGFDKSVSQADSYYLSDVFDNVLSAKGQDLSASVWTVEFPRGDNADLESEFEPDFLNVTQPIISDDENDPILKKESNRANNLTEKSKESVIMELWKQTDNNHPTDSGLDEVVTALPHSKLENDIFENSRDFYNCNQFDTDVTVYNLTVPDVNKSSHYPESKLESTAKENNIPFPNVFGQSNSIGFCPSFPVIQGSGVTTSMIKPSFLLKTGNRLEASSSGKRL